VLCSFSGWSSRRHLMSQGSKFRRGAEYFNTCRSNSIGRRHGTVRSEYLAFLHRIRPSISSFVDIGSCSPVGSNDDDRQNIIKCGRRSKRPNLIQSSQNYNNNATGSIVFELMNRAYEFANQVTQHAITPVQIEQANCISPDNYYIQIVPAFASPDPQSSVVFHSLQHSGLIPAEELRSATTLATAPIEAHLFRGADISAIALVPVTQNNTELSSSTLLCNPPFKVLIEIYETGVPNVILRSQVFEFGDIRNYSIDNSIGFVPQSFINFEDVLPYDIDLQIVARAVQA